MRKITLVVMGKEEFFTRLTLLPDRFLLDLFYLFRLILSASQDVAPSLSWYVTIPLFRISFRSLQPHQEIVYPLTVFFCL